MRSTKKENTSTNNFFLPDILKKSENNTRNPFKRKTKANLSEINKFLHDHKRKIGNDNKWRVIKKRKNKRWRKTKKGDRNKSRKNRGDKRWERKGEKKEEERKEEEIR